MILLVGLYLGCAASMSLGVPLLAWWQNIRKSHAEEREREFIQRARELARWHRGR